MSSLVPRLSPCTTEPGNEANYCGFPIAGPLAIGCTLIAEAFSASGLGMKLVLFVASGLGIVVSGLGMRLVCHSLRPGNEADMMEWFTYRRLR